ncbi:MULTISPECIES: aliphatic sulfonate ABC transporter substrate-binding protein [Methylorubrum]|jgi:sulfonate transport system substrate-binding protein|uniref:Putative aliphatic sulfonates-binding protein n=2 Tax=Methylorubrum extorquens TaxID=408 RepID=C5AZ38_METEA|nr:MULTISPECIES: aliphatic sulfonate ABC transporter substrate-binding protein [Methylorubrum]ACS41350.1 alkanesulfonate transport protein, periplasmic-binding subunit, ABC superfamily [Methylorubrum extorquens AM1]EHP85910.1 aliphatic sulfonates family ABC transporter, periplasmic ligand-binding protein [Methylorubrum extorquens DSM 13060]MCP1540469.1 sulfonate transport system substrate-binding protein [Methylorubrum extorquens]MCP1586994.1 sulfonate transport system substrate-binding protein
MNRRSAARLVLAGLTLSLALGCNPAAAEESTLRIGYQRSSALISLLREDATLETALKPLGVTVSWHEFTSGLPIMEALNVGRIDVSADVADTVPVFAQAANAKITYIAQEAASPEAQAILVPGDSPLKTVADLKGRKVAVTKGAGSHYLLLAALKAEGLPFKSINPAYLTPADGRSALSGGSVDAWVAWDPFLSAAQIQAGARILRDGTGLSAYKRYYLASDAYAEKRADVLTLLVTKLREAGTWVKANPDAAAARLGALWKIEPEIVKQANARRSYRVEPVSRAGLAEQQTIADAFRAEGLLPRAVDASALPVWELPSR